MQSKDLAGVLTLADELCRGRGARLTKRRRAVLRRLCESDKPLSAYELLDRLRAVVKNPVPPTVYRALVFLLERGLVHKLENLHAYVGCAHPEHSHAGQFLICADCGEVAELDDEHITESLQAAGHAVGFRTRRPVVELLGICARCE